ncbi:MAG: universal stress protein [Planctomycetaceae bacterium]|nr:MAG: universal stress protein [Planctomycetaceae bacterium]
MSSRSKEMIKRILVGLAGTAYTPVAIERAVTLAQTHAAEVTGVTVLDSHRVRSLSGAAPPPRDEVEAIHGSRRTITETRIAQSIRDFEVACQTAGIKFRVAEESGDAFTSLVDLARYHDLMVFGLRSIFDYEFHAGDPESILIRLVSAGVRPLVAVSETFHSISRVVIAYNGSMESAKAMKQFVQMRLWPGAELKIVTFHPSDSQALELLRAAEEYCRAHGFRVCHQSNTGDPKVLLLSAATLWQADMIVMGNSARSVLLRKVLGDTLLATLRDTQIPLFLSQ